MSLNEAMMLVFILAFGGATFVLGRLSMMYGAEPEPEPPKPSAEEEELRQLLRDIEDNGPHDVDAGGLLDKPKPPNVNPLFSPAVCHYDISWRSWMKSNPVKVSMYPWKVRRDEDQYGNPIEPPGHIVDPPKDGGIQP